jgi:DNA-binding XRE family transcriptional regulator
MMIEMDKKTKKIYGYHNGLVYIGEDGLWSPCIHRPHGVMVPLDRKAYPHLYQSFDAKFDGGSRCTAIRLECGLSQHQFAAMVGMTQQAISRLESGERNETKIHSAMLRCVEIINDEGLLEKLRA